MEFAAQEVLFGDFDGWSKLPYLFACNIQYRKCGESNPFLLTDLVLRLDLPDITLCSSSSSYR